MDDAAAVELAQLLGGHAEELHVVGQEMAGGRQEEREASRADQDQRAERQKGAAVADKGLQIAAARVVGQSAVSPLRAYRSDGLIDFPIFWNSRPGAARTLPKPRKVPPTALRSPMVNEVPAAPGLAL
jgi:hypothetical protein